MGKPAYGYETAEDENGKIILVIDPSAYRALHWCRERGHGGRAPRRPSA
ncbi:hypothetical protein ACRAWF_34665 [Streptomyces sp. L7]